MNLLNRKISVRVSMVVLVITILLVSVAVIYAVSSNFTVPNTFTSGTTISSSEMNANFQALGQALPASKTSVSSGSISIVDTTGSNISSLAVTPPSNGYLLVFGRATVTAVSGPMLFFSISRTSASGDALAQDIVGGTRWEIGVIDLVYPQGAVTAGTTLYYSFKANVQLNGPTGTGTVEGASLSAIFIPAPNQLP